jgi:ADP-L-glycero-D-manno-heptose 6-epimerase
MFIITGGAGLIGSVLLARLNEEGISDILVVDNLSTDEGRSPEKWKNLRQKQFSDYLHKDQLQKLILGDGDLGKIDAVFHLGACSSPSEQDAEYLMQNNYRFSRMLATWTAKRGSRFIYASSAGTYGDGEIGFDDDDSKVESLRPISAYGFSKQLVDLWALRSGLSQRSVGLKFFNVFGPNEYHKGNMRSMVKKAHEQVTSEGTIHLFKSYRKDFKDGEQKRDFVYVKDCADVMFWLLENPGVNGIFNVGTGQARTWNDLALAVFKAMDLSPNIQYEEMPEEMRVRYQYFTQANTEKIRATGYQKPWTSLETAVDDYVRNYLEKGPAFV